MLIIYYKQITEGFDDRERFQIMEKVGMSAAEVKKTITRQVLLVFFLPLGMAVIHIAVAFPQLCKMLTVFSMTNIKNVRFIYRAFRSCFCAGLSACLPADSAHIL